MATIVHRGKSVETAGELPTTGTMAPPFRLTKTDLSDIQLLELRGKRIVLNIFPSVDTPTCATSVRRFNELASSLSNTIVLCVSKDLPFAHKRFCGAEGLDRVIGASEYKDQSFSQGYGVDIISGSALVGLMSRAVVVIDETGKVMYTEQVYDISQEPDYEPVLKLLSE